MNYNYSERYLSLKRNIKYSHIKDEIKYYAQDAARLVLVGIVFIMAMVAILAVTY